MENPSQFSNALYALTAAFLGGGLLLLGTVFAPRILHRYTPQID